MQEFLLAKEVLFHIGKVTIQPELLWRALSGAVKALNEECGYYILSRKAIQTQLPPEELRRLLDKLSLIRELFNSQSILRTGTVSMTITRCVLDLARQRSCSDERDRIYGMIGIDPELAIVPDYTLAPEEVYWDFFTRSLLSGNFALLHACSAGTSTPGAPSFLPTFSISDSGGHSQNSQPVYHPIRASFRTTFASGRGFSASIRVTQSRHLCIRGVLIGSIVSKLGFSDSATSTIVRATDTSTDDICYDVSKDPPKTPFLPLRANRVELGKNTLYHLFPDYTNTPAWSSDVFSHIPCPYGVPDFTFFWSPYAIYSSVHDLLQAMYQATKPPSSKTSRLDTGLRRAMSSNTIHNLPFNTTHRNEMLDRVMFRTDADHVGVATSCVQPGDRVVVFDGDTTPFVLRGAGSSGEGEAELWSVVGDCWVYGFMAGDYDGHTVVNGEGTSLRLKKPYTWEQKRKANFYRRFKPRQGKERRALVKQTFVLC